MNLLNNIAKLSLITATLFTSSCCMSEEASTLNVTFKHIQAHQGNLMVALYDASNYTGNKAASAAAMIPVSGETVDYVFENLESGTYAIKLFHDENENGKMDTNILGIPKEGYGFSNNVGRFGEPAFEEAAFTVIDNTSIEIIVR